MTFLTYSGKKRKRNTKRHRRAVSAALCLLFILSSFFADRIPARAETGVSYEGYRDMAGTYSIDESIPGYREYRESYPQIYPEEEIVIDAVDYVRYEDHGTPAVPDVMSDYEGMEGESIVTGESGLVEYDFSVTAPGYYELSLLYYPIEGKSTAIRRSVFIDGELPFRECSLLQYQRIWTNEIVRSGGEEICWQKDNQGNDIKPRVVEIPEWIRGYSYDTNGYITDRLKIYLDTGMHTITLLSLQEPMLLRSITFSNSQKPLSYGEVKADLDASGVTQSHGQSIRVEAETAVRTSSQMLYPKQDQSSPAVYPSSPKLLLNNVIGGESWQQAGQWIEWEIEVPEDGYYRIALYDRQNFTRGIYVSRRISIDGAVPFSEMEAYGFDYRQSWRLDVLSDDGGTPYEFYLTEGKHTFRMEVVLGDLSEIIQTVQESVRELNAIYRQVIRITGVSPDQYRDYQLSGSIPGLEGELTVVRARIDEAITRLESIEGKNTDKTTVLITMRDQLDELIYDQERFAEVISSYRINVRACGNWISQILPQPLQIDRIYVYSPDSPPKISHANLLARLWYEIRRLFFSFVVDYNKIGNIADGTDDGVTITLWLGTGRDQANVIKNLIDENFTPQTNINVNVSLVDMSALLRAELAGEGPDVAIQVGGSAAVTGAATAGMIPAGNDTPVNYGIRHAVMDLTSFPDYGEVAERFSESALLQFGYDGAQYALPDTQSFPMMFYRKDILNEIGLEVPKTWDDVKVAMTVLSRNQMEFGMLPCEPVFAMLLYQAGGEYYREDGMASALDTDIAVGAFKDYCAYYTDYRLDKETSLEERFRTGECPIIITDYTVYNNLVVSAPDIDGLWDFTMVPGTPEADGTICHATGSTGLADMILSGTEHPKESWEFLKWWTSAETQTMYGREMESLMGESARVATANLEALSCSSWQIDAYEELSGALSQTRGIPQVPGGYYTWRNVNNAFYRVTTDTDAVTPREELMEVVGYINAEIGYKRGELGLPTVSEERSE